MPRTYVKKRKGPAYTLEDLQNAVYDIKSNRKSYREAGDFYNIPISVIFNRIKGRTIPIDKMGAGCKKVFSTKEEIYFVECIKIRSRAGYPCDKAELFHLIQQYVVTKGIKTPFKDNKPGEDWYRLFMDRNPSIRLKIPEHLQKARKDARKPEIIYHFYQQVEQLINKNNLMDKPMLVFNADESGFNMDPARVRALGEKGKTLSRVSGGSGRESVTVLACVSADGKYLPPLIVFKGVAVQARWTSQNAIPGTLYTTSKNGWMEEPQFFEWFTTGFIPHVNKIRTLYELGDTNAVLFYDGHKSHYSVRIIQAALDNHVELMKFPSHLTDKIQPLDKCVFKSVKNTWNKKLVKYGRDNMGHSSGRLSKTRFVDFLCETWRESMTEHNIISGFRSTGVFPVDSSKFPEEDFNSNELKQYHMYVDSSLTQPSTSKEYPKSISDKSSLKPPISEIEIISEVQPLELTQLLESDDIPIIFLNENNTSIDDKQQHNESVVQCPDGNSTTPATIQQNISVISPLQEVSPKASSSNEGPTPTKACLLNIFGVGKRKEISPEEKKEKKIIPRLSLEKYGEVLTTEEVIERLKKAEDNKKRKLEGKNKKIKKTGKNSLPVRRSKQIGGEEKENEIKSISETEVLIEVNKNTLKAGRYGLAKFASGKKNPAFYNYLFVVNNIDWDEEEVSITAYKCLDESRKNFIINENDSSFIKINQIIGLLPDPDIVLKGERVFYRFKTAVDVFEKA